LEEAKKKQHEDLEKRFHTFLGQLDESNIPNRVRMLLSFFAYRTDEKFWQSAYPHFEKAFIEGICNSDRAPQVLAYMNGTQNPPKKYSKEMKDKFMLVLDVCI